LGSKRWLQSVPGTAEALGSFLEQSMAHQMPAFSRTRGSGRRGGGQEEARGGQGGGWVTKYKELCRTPRVLESAIGCSELPGTAEASWQLPQRKLGTSNACIQRDQGSGRRGARGGQGGRGRVTKYKELCRTPRVFGVHANGCSGLPGTAEALRSFLDGAWHIECLHSAGRGGSGKGGRGGGVSHQIQRALLISSGIWGARDGCSGLPGTAEALWQLPQRSLAHQMPAFSGNRGSGRGAGGVRAGEGCQGGGGGVREGKGETSHSPGYIQRPGWCAG